MAEPRSALGTVVRLALACLGAGLVMAMLGVTPADLLDDITALAGRAWRLSTDLLGWAGPYMLLGAIVVLPLWLMHLLWKKLSTRPERKPER